MCTLVLLYVDYITSEIYMSRDKLTKLDLTAKEVDDMEELIKINFDDNSDRPTVSGRELHERLGIRTAYKDWFPRMCEYGFVEGKDFNPLKSEQLRNEGDRQVKREIIDHQITIDMAKELCMIQRSDVGKRCREYFLDVERQFNNPEAIMARALKIADQKLLEVQNQVAQLTERNSKLVEKNDELNIQVIQKNQKIDQLRPLANYSEIILSNPSLITITQIAKDYGWSGVRLNKELCSRKVQYKQNGQWILYSKYQDKGYVHSKTVEITADDGTHKVVQNTMWTQAGRRFIYLLLKKDGIVPLIEST